MSEKVTKMPYTKGKAAALTVLCCVLTFLVCTLLIGCFAAHRVVFEEDMQEAFSKVETENIRLSDGTPLVTKISRDYIGEGVLAEDKLTKILRDGTFRKWIGQTAASYNDYTAGRTDLVPEITTPAIEALINENDSTIRLYTGMHDFAAENPQILRNIKPDLESWNQRMRTMLSTGFSAKLIAVSVSEWIWYVLGALLAVLLVWMIVICVKGQDHVGTAFKRYAVTCFIPGILMLLWGLLGGLILKLAGMGYIRGTVDALHGAPIMFGGLTCLTCVALFILGIIWNTAAEAIASRPRRVKSTPVAAPAPAPAPAVSLTKPAEPIVNAPEPAPAATRKFCRFCGGELVNSDAKFCYKCGKAQE